MAQEAIARARRGEGPTLIEAETYRFRGHSLADPDELRKKEEKAAYQVRSCWAQTCASHINVGSARPVAQAGPAEGRSSRDVGSACWHMHVRA